MLMPYHFIVDTSFILDYPLDRYAFANQPFTIVICDTVRRELEYLQHDRKRGPRARQALQTIYALGVELWLS